MGAFWNFYTNNNTNDQHCKFFIRMKYLITEYVTGSWFCIIALWLCEINMSAFREGSDGERVKWILEVEVGGIFITPRSIVNSFTGKRNVLCMWRRLGLREGNKGGGRNSAGEIFSFYIYSAFSFTFLTRFSGFCLCLFHSFSPWRPSYPFDFRGMKRRSNILGSWFDCSKLRRKKYSLTLFSTHRYETCPFTEP